MRLRIAATTALSSLLVLALIGVLGMARKPAPIPDGATSLALRTQPPAWRLPFVPHVCPLAGLLPVRLVRDGGSLAFDVVEGGQRVSIVFPYGFAGRLVSGRAELVSPEGLVLAREGDVLSELGGSSADTGDFLVCFSTPDEYARVVGP